MEPQQQQPLRGKRKSFPISKLIPNLLTMAGLCFGMSAIRFALDGRWELSVSLLIAAAIVDGMDGRVARMLNSTSTFGAQLDSLADFVSFGVAPGIVMYLWSLHDIKGVGWAAALFFAICTAMRLARFNTSAIEEKKEEWKQQFFVGVPSPAGALLCVLPMVISFQFEMPSSGYAALNIFYVSLIALLMASRLPTFAVKHIRIRHESILPVMLGAGILIGGLIVEPWFTLSLIGGGYIITFFFSAQRYRRLKEEHSTIESGDK